MKSIAISTFAFLLGLSCLDPVQNLRAQTPDMIYSAKADERMPEAIPKKLTPGKKKVEEAYAFQRRLLHGLETIDSVIKNWARTARMAEVKKDPDALGTALGCEGLMEIERDSLTRADSLLRRAMPYFKYKDSKSYFLLSLAQTESKLSFYHNAFFYYGELLTHFDSLDALNDILYYAESGYAPYSYGIDAALHISIMGLSIEALKKPAITLIERSAKTHYLDALGLMCLTALKHLDTANAESYDFKIEQLCSRRPTLRKSIAKFEKQFSEAKQ